MVYVPTETGEWVSEDFERLARVIKDYDQNLELRWIPPDRRTRDDKEPFAVVDTLTNTVVFHATETETPENILTRIFTADNKHGNVLDRLEARNAAIEIMNKKKQIDEMEELGDVANFLYYSPLNYVKHNGKKLDHNRRPVL